VAPVELKGFAGRESQRHKRMRRSPGALVTPSLGEAMHAVVRAVVAAPAQFLEQTLRRPALPSGEIALLLQDLRQDIDPRAELRHGLHATLILELGLVAPNDLAHCRPRDRQRPHDLLDRKTLLKIRAPNIAEHVHGHHPPKPFPATRGQEGC
jgi:hypothetical protein